MSRIVLSIAAGAAALGLLLILSARVVGALLPAEGQVVFASDRDGEDIDLYLLDVTRGAIINLTHSPGSDFQPAWSPDGLMLAFVSDRPGNREIYTRRVGCPNLFSACPAALRRITHNPTIDFGPAWSPAGDALLYAREWFNSTELVISTVDGNTYHFLTDNEFLDADPSWSPDGTHIVFASDRAVRYSSDLYVIDTACLIYPETCGSKARPLLAAPGNQLLPSWSPDGTRLLFTTSGASSRQLAIADLEGTITPVLDEQGADDMPAWSPDGHSIVFQSYRGDQANDIYILRLDCPGEPLSCLRRLTADPAFDLNPRWRPVN